MRLKTIWIVSVIVVAIIFMSTFVDIETIERFLLKNEAYSEYLFLSSWIVRIVLFIPPTALVVLGGMTFSPEIGVILSSVGLIVSSTLVFYVAKSSIGVRMYNRFVVKHADIVALMKRYNVKILALGVINPLVPADIICFIAAALGMRYRKFMSVIFIANTPMRILYSYVGMTFKNSIWSLFLTVGSIVVVSMLSVNMWKSYKTELDGDGEMDG